MAKAKPTKLEKWQLTTRSDFLSERYAMEVVSNKSVRATIFRSGSDEVVYLNEIRGLLATAFMTGFYTALGGSPVMEQMMRNDQSFYIEREEEVLRKHKTTAEAQRVARYEAQQKAHSAAVAAARKRRLARAKARKDRAE